METVTEEERNLLLQWLKLHLDTNLSWGGVNLNKALEEAIDILTPGV